MPLRGTGVLWGGSRPLSRGRLPDEGSGAENGVNGSSFCRELPRPADTSHWAPRGGPAAMEMTTITDELESTGVRRNLRLWVLLLGLVAILAGAATGTVTSSSADPDAKR